MTTSKKLTVAILKDLLAYYFKSDANKEKGIWKPQLVNITTQLFVENNGKEVVREKEQNIIGIMSDQESNQSESNNEDDMSLVVIDKV